MDQREYGNILESLQNIRAGVMASCQQELMFTGMMPPSAQAELKVVGDITGAVFHGLSNLGFSVAEDPANPAMVTVTVNGRSYNCLKMQMGTVPVAAVLQAASIPTVPTVPTASVQGSPRSASIVDKPEPPVVPTVPTHPVQPKGPGYAPVVSRGVSPAEYIQAEAAYGAEVSAPADIMSVTEEPVAEVMAEPEAPVMEPEASPIVEETPVAAEAVFEPEITEEEPAEEKKAPVRIDPKDLFDDDDDEEDEEDVYPSEEPENIPEPEDEPQAEPAPVMSLTDAINQGAIPDIAEDNTMPEIDEPADFGASAAPVVESAPVSQMGGAKVIGGGAKVIGGGPVSVGGIGTEDFFLDEYEKMSGEFIYSYSRISVTHGAAGGGGKPEEMLIMVAPLKIYKNAQSSVPIIVAIVHNGKSKIASSYDILEEGKNIVTIDIDEFYFLCRGSFKEDGRFVATVVTTGPSSQQGDKIRPLSSTSHGNNRDPQVRNGHIKFHYTGFSGPGSIEVVPFGKIDNEDGSRPEDFVVIVKNKEFVDYYLISKSLKVNNRAIIYGENNVMNELLCHWESDKMVAELI